MTGYAAVAAALREAAAILDLLAQDAPDLHAAPYVRLGIMPGPDLVDPDLRTRDAVDTVATALLGSAGAVDRSMHVTGGVHYARNGLIGPVSVGVHGRIPDPDAEDLRAELELLRAELAARDTTMATAADEAEWLARRTAGTDARAGAEEPC